MCQVTSECPVFGILCRLNCVFKYANVLPWVTDVLVFPFSVPAETCLMIYHVKLRCE